MIRVVTLCSLLAYGLFEAHATPETEVRGAIAGLLAAPNFAWSRECEWTNAPGDQPKNAIQGFNSVAKGKTEKAGFTTATMEITSPGYLARVPGPYHTVKGVFGGQRGVVDFGKGWISAADFPDMFLAAHKFSDEKEKNGVLSVLLWASPFIASGEAMPGAMLRAILNECTECSALGRAFSVRLSPAGERQMLDMARRHTYAFVCGPVEAVTRCSVRCWISEGQLTKLEVHVAGKVDWGRNEMLMLNPSYRPAPGPDSRNLDYTGTVVFSEAGTAEPSVPKAARDKLRESDRSNEPRTADSR